MRRSAIVPLAVVGGLLVGAAPAPAASTAVRLARLEARMSSLEKQVRILQGRLNGQVKVNNVLATEYICTPYVKADYVDPGNGLVRTTAVWPNAFYFPSKIWGNQSIGGRTIKCGSPKMAAARRAAIDGYLQKLPLPATLGGTAGAGS